MNPFAGALRIQQREVDSLRASISLEAGRVGSLEDQQSRQSETERQERAVAAQILLPSDAWATRMRHERSRLAEERRHAEARLAQLREQATEVYGTMRAIEMAAQRYTDEAERVIAAAEQAQSDDLAGTRHLRRGNGTVENRR